MGFFSGESYLKTKIEPLGVFIATNASLLPGLPSGQHTELGSVCACNFFIPEFVSQLLIPIKHHRIFPFQYIYSSVQSYDTCNVV